MTYQTATIRAYRQTESGLVMLISLATDAQGNPHNCGGLPLTRTDEIVELLGWPDSHCRVYETAGGGRVYVPEVAQ